MSFKVMKISEENNIAYWNEHLSSLLPNEAQWIIDFGTINPIAKRIIELGDYVYTNLGGIPDYSSAKELSVLIFEMRQIEKEDQ